MNRKEIVTFFVIWLGQVVSTVGTRMTRFGLLIWVYQETGQASAIAAMGFFGWGAEAVASPIAGYWIDRIDRRRIMLWADMGAGLTTVAVMALMLSGNMQLWHLLAAQGIVGVFDAFHTNAFNVSITMLVPKSQYGRANGMRSFSNSIGEVLAPILAGMVLVISGIEIIFFIDVITFLFAVVTLLIVRIPNPAIDHSNGERESFVNQLSFGWRYIRDRDGLVGLLAVMAVINLFAALTYYSIFPAMILARSGGSEQALARAEAALGVGGIIGSMIMSIWGGPRPRIHGVLAYTGLSFLVGDLLLGAGRNIEVWMIAGIAGAAFIPFITGSNMAIWQSKVPPGMQGRVLSVQFALRHLMFPIGFVLGGVLADFVFEPGMMVGGTLEPYFGWLVGNGEGAGMGLMFIMTGIGGGLTGFGGYLFATLRRVESDLPDHDVVAGAALQMR